MNRPKDIAVYGGYDSSGIINTGGQSDEWNAVTAIKYSLSHPVFLEALSGDTSVYISSSDYDKLIEQFSPIQPDLTIDMLSDLRTLFGNNNNFRADGDYLQNGYYQIESRNGTSFYIGRSYEGYDGGYMAQLKRDKEAFQNKSLKRCMYLGCMNPIIHTVWFKKNTDKTYRYPQSIPHTEDIKTIPEIKYLLPKWFFDKYCIDNI